MMAGLSLEKGLEPGYREFLPRGVTRNLSASPILNTCQVYVNATIFLFVMQRASVLFRFSFSNILRGIVSLSFL